MRSCLDCGKKLEGRVDKKFCDPYCKSNYHYERNKVKDQSLFKKVDQQLKLNRRLLRQFNKAGKAVVRAEHIMALGFNPNYFTNYWKNKKGDVYLFVYEFGFLKRKENGKWKYILIQWQDYMKA